MPARLRNSLFILLAAGSLAVGWLLLWSDRDATVTELSPPAGSPFASTAVSADWIGSDACRECHNGQHRSWLETAHSVALAAVDADREPPDGTVRLEDDQRLCSVYRQDGELRHREEMLLPDGGRLPLADHAVDHVIGSGRFSRSYLVETDGFLVESPVTWYAARQKWGPSPGYANNWSGFERPAELRCVECHAGRVTPVENSLHRLTIHEQAIGCERCHGPGSAHRDRWSAEDPAAAMAADGDRTIVHPGRLNRERNEAICAQCHLHGDATVSIRGRSLADFRPGLRLRDFLVSFSVGPDEKQMEVVGHVEQMRRSACYIGSDTLTCTTCHDPHSRLDEAESLNWYRSRCLSCHTEDSCGLDHATRIAQQPQDDCTACHMPQVPTEIPHFTFTHHLIGVHTELPKHGRRESISSFEPAGELIPLSDVSHLPLRELDRLKGLGYLQLQTANSVHASEYTRLAVEHLLQFREAGLEDPDVDAALARLFWQSDPSMATS
ncbi:MAG: hypothetical protein KDA79_23065, partial [Planctomycetaceae bacterium]|nr:hypothetical protein [Planctomycetaceae bacterium]